MFSKPCSPLAALAFALTLSASACSKSSSPDSAGSSATASVAPEGSSSQGLVKLTIPAGLRPLTAEQALQRVATTNKKGVVINAWASWCGPCREEIPLLLELSQKLPDLDFVFVSVDEIDKLGPVIERMDELHMPRPSYVAMPPIEDFKLAMNPRWKGGLPATFLFDPTGRQRYWWGAQVFEPEIRPILDGFLAGKEIDGEANFKVRHQPTNP
jgi:thiol-disulfide isomerase/thioredoxin